MDYEDPLHPIGKLYTNIINFDKAYVLPYPNDQKIGFGIHILKNKTDTFGSSFKK